MEMNQKNLKFLLTSLLVLLLAFSCTMPGKQAGKIGEPGKINFILGSDLTPSRSLVLTTTTPKFILVTIKNNAGGNLVLEKEKIELFSNGEEYLSTSISLTEGSYQLTEFLVIDDADTIIYATPIAGSENAYLVDRPLPLDFTITGDATTTMTPEVVAVTESLTKYGYVAFSLEIKENILRNGNFSNGTSNWEIWMNDGAQAEMVAENGELKATVLNSGEYPWKIGIRQNGFPLEYGVDYKFSFQARSDSIQSLANVIQLDRDPWIAYSASKTFTLNSTMTEYSYTFTMNHLTDNAADVEFFIGGKGTGTIYLDNVLLQKVPSNTPEEVYYDSIDPEVDRSNIITYEIVPGSYNGGSWDGGYCLKGITSKLDKIKELGINCIWLTPVFEGEGMGYWPLDYYRINRKLGTLNDMKELVFEAHNRHIMVILDLVVNHTWTQHPFFQDVLINKSQSAYKDYYMWKGEPGASEYEYYFDWIYVPNLNLSKQEVRDYLYGVAEYWVKKLDIDGYRVDCAWALEDRWPGFVTKLREKLTAIKSNIFLLAEGNVNQERFFNNGYDSAYDWDLRGWGYEDSNALPNLFDGLMTPKEVHNILTRSLPANGLPFRFAENHDHPRAATLWGVDGSKIAHTIIMTARGYAHVFGGGEVGFAPVLEDWSQNIPIVWDFSAPIYSYFQKIIAIRNQYLKSNLNQYWINNDSNAVYSSLAVSGTNRLITVANCSAQETTVTLNLTNPELGTINGLTELISDTSVSYNGSGTLTLTLEGYETAVFLIN
jgi:glycosidase